MASNTGDLERSWAGLPAGARAAIEQQWAGLAAGGLPCGSAVVDSDGRVISKGRNHSYDPPGGLESRLERPLQHNRLAHAEMNALAVVPTETDHVPLTLWTTQHPCLMCAATVQFIGVGSVSFIADDPSDNSPRELIVARRGRVPYAQLPEPLWWTICNLFFLYNSAVQHGVNARNLKLHRERNPGLVALTIELAKDDKVGRLARAGAAPVSALTPHHSELAGVMEYELQHWRTSRSNDEA